MKLERARPLVLTEDDDRPRRGLPAGWWKPAVAAVSVAVFSFGVWYAYSQGVRAGSESVAPLIRADATAVKDVPEEAGGLSIPDRDKLIYSRLSGEEPSAPKVEHLLPPPMADRPPEEVARSLAAEPADGSPKADAVASASPAAAGAAKGATAGDARGSEAPSAAAATAASPPAGAAPAPERPAPQQAAAAAPSPTAAMIGPFRIQLAALKTPEDAARMWGRLQNQHKDLLGRLDLIVEKVRVGNENNVLYRLQAGPFKTQADAQQVCAALGKRKVSCLFVKA